MHGEVFVCGAESRNYVILEGADGAFGDPILVVGTDAAEVDLLIHGSDVIPKGLGGEDAVIGTITLDLHSPSFSGPSFERLLSLESVTGTKRGLMASKDDGATMVDGEGYAKKLKRLLLLPFCVRHSAGDAGLILVQRGTITGIEVVSPNGMAVASVGSANRSSLTAG